MYLPVVMIQSERPKCKAYTGERCADPFEATGSPRGRGRVSKCDVEKKKKWRPRICPGVMWAFACFFYFICSTRSHSLLPFPSLCTVVCLVSRFRKCSKEETMSRGRRSITLYGCWSPRGSHRTKYSTLCVCTFFFNWNDGFCVCLSCVYVWFMCFLIGGIDDLSLIFLSIDFLLLVLPDAMLRLCILL